MSADWKPGDVGVAYSGERFIVTSRGECFWPGATPENWSGVSGIPTTEDRPLVVIDPDDAEQVKRLYDAWMFAEGEGARGRDIASLALRGFASPTPEECGHRVDLVTDSPRIVKTETYTCTRNAGHSGKHGSGSFSWVTS